MKYLIIFSSLISLLNLSLSIYLFNIDMCILNEGIAFGIRIEYEIFASLFLLLILIFVGMRVEGLFKYLILSIVILGSSNLISRLVLNSVCDYIHILYISFNLADISLVLLVLFSGIYLLKSK